MTVTDKRTEDYLNIPWIIYPAYEQRCIESLQLHPRAYYGLMPAGFQHMDPEQKAKTNQLEKHEVNITWEFQMHHY